MAKRTFWQEFMTADQDRVQVIATDERPEIILAITSYAGRIETAYLNREDAASLIANLAQAIGIMAGSADSE